MCMTLQDVELEIEELKTERFRRVMHSIAGCIRDSQVVVALNREISELEVLADEMREAEYK